ncbi:hypothetical protein L1887_56907 [Cichorium endivia]|nr:hypothetical protein L1887_56907 [Cichorium endivia]
MHGDEYLAQGFSEIDERRYLIAGQYSLASAIGVIDSQEADGSLPTMPRQAKRSNRSRLCSSGAGKRSRAQAAFTAALAPPHAFRRIQFLAASCDLKDVMAALHRNFRIRQAGRVIGAWAIDRAETGTFSGRLLVLLELHTHHGLVSVGARTAVPGWFVYQERSYLVRSANRLACQAATLKHQPRADEEDEVVDEDADEDEEEGADAEALGAAVTNTCAARPSCSHATLTSYRSRTPPLAITSSEANVEGGFAVALNRTGGCGPCLRAVRGLADDLDRGVGDAVMLSVSVGRRFGGFLELALSGAMMLPTDRREKWAGSRTWSSMSPV